jgi:spermidine synthase
VSSTIRIREERGVRYLHFGSLWVQGAMRLSRPHALELEYTREMMFPLLLRAQDEWPSRVLLIGLGAASMVKFLHRHRPRTRLTVVELRQEVVDAARAFFALPDDDPGRVSIAIADGAAFVAAGGPRYDLILVDGYDARGRVGGLDTPAFYEHCRARLRRDGIVATNLLSRHRGVDASVDRMRAAFHGRAFALMPCASGNVTAVAVTGSPVELGPQVLDARARELRATTGLNLLPTLARLARADPAGRAI